MEVAAIGDVHANLPALEAVLAHAQRRGVEQIWNIGDFVGYGAFPEDVVIRLRQEAVVSIVGNYDRKVLEFERKSRKWKRTKHPDKWLAFKWAFENLSEPSRQYLRSLPEQRRIAVAGRCVLLTHGSPASVGEHLRPGTPVERLRELAQIARADVIVCGHSHQPFARQVDEAWWVNTGSVGRPDDGDPRACYATLRFDGHAVDVRHWRVSYDTTAAANAARAAGLPEVFAQMVLQGRSLDDVLPPGDGGRGRPPTG